MLVEPMGFVEERGYLLPFIDDDLADRITCSNLAAEQLGIMEVAAKLFRFEKIDPQRVRVSCLEERSFTRLPGPPKKESLSSCFRKMQPSFEHVLQIIMII